MKRRVGYLLSVSLSLTTVFAMSRPKRLPTNQLRRGQIIDQDLLERAAVAQPIQGWVLPMRWPVRLPSVKPDLASSPQL
jgi:hypothetical protein